MNIGTQPRSRSALDQLAFVAPPETCVDICNAFALAPLQFSETTMTRTTQFLACLICSAMTISLVGANGFQEDDTSSSQGKTTTKTQATRPLQSPSTKVAVTPAEDSSATGQQARQAENLVKVYALKNLPASTAKRLLGVISDASDQTRIEADTYSNSIIASASKEQHSKIAALLIETDQLSANTAQDKTANTKSDKHPPKFLPYARDARPAEIWLHKMLQTPVPKLNFPGETALSEILEQIADYYTTTHGASGGGTPLKFTILPDILELELESINSLENVIIRDIALEGQTLENSLKIILEQTDPLLTYEIRNEVMFITTLAKAVDSSYTRVYEVEHLLTVAFEQHIAPIVAPYPSGPQAWSGGGMNGGGASSQGQGQGLGGGGLGGGGGMGGGGGFFSVQFGGQSAGGMNLNSGQKSNTTTQPAPEPRNKKKKRNRTGSRKTKVQISYIDVHSLIHTIQSVTFPCQWQDIQGQGGVITPVGDTLIITQTQNGHQQIARLLNLLTDATRKPAD